jgi:fermentation-respiration switch protein FrsA (DUF1100 family)
MSIAALDADVQPRGLAFELRGIRRRAAAAWLARQGWLLYPRGFDPSKTYPLVVSIHGGPASMLRSHWPGWGDRAAALAGAGYFALYPNPRGSIGLARHSSAPT